MEELQTVFSVTSPAGVNVTQTCGPVVASIFIPFEQLDVFIKSLMDANAYQVARNG